jgi:hypothetical protein
LSGNNYMNLFVAADISDRRDQERYSRRLDLALAQERLTLDDIVGIGECGTAGSLDLYVVHRRVIVLTTEQGMFTKKLTAEKVCDLASLAHIRGTREGFKGRDVTLTGTDADGQQVLRIGWGLGGPDWVERAVAQQRQHLFDVITTAMDQLYEPPLRPSVAGVPSKAAALREWASAVVEASGVVVTTARVEEHAGMIAGTIRMLAFLPLGGVQDLGEFYPDPGKEMPSGSVLATFDDLYEHVVRWVGNAAKVDRAIDQMLSEAWGEYVSGCHQTYAEA